MQGRRYKQFTENSPNDIALSCWEYEDFVDAVNDDRLSAKTLMKFKNLYRAHSYMLLVVPIATFIPAFVANKWLVAFAKRGMASSRFNFFGMALLYPIFLYFGYTLPIHRKLYTQILTEPGDDGDYVRDCVSYHKPQLWKKISRQIQALDIDLKQNLISKTSFELPTNFVSSRSIF